MPIDFYHVPGSAPCRAVALAAAAVGVSLNAKPVNLMKGEQMKPEFLKMNPQHTVPTINDNGFILWERLDGNRSIHKVFRPLHSLPLSAQCRCRTCTIFQMTANVLKEHWIKLDIFAPSHKKDP